MADIFDQVIEDEIAKATCVMVIWSEATHAARATCRITILASRTLDTS